MSYTVRIPYRVPAQLEYVRISKYDSTPLSGCYHWLRFSTFGYTRKIALTSLSRSPSLYAIPHYLSRLVRGQVRVLERTLQRKLLLIPPKWKFWCLLRRSIFCSAAGSLPQLEMPMSITRNWRKKRVPHNLQRSGSSDPRGTSKDNTNFRSWVIMQ